MATLRPANNLEEKRFGEFNFSVASVSSVAIIEVMVAMNEIKEFGRRVGRQFNARKVILFGSYAEGTADENSDIDLLVVANTNLRANERYGAVRKLLSDCPAGFDIVVETPDEYTRWRSVVNHIAYFAHKYGKVLYEQTDS